jgi:hypothetical protein
MLLSVHLLCHYNTAIVPLTLLPSLSQTSPVVVGALFVVVDVLVLVFFFLKLSNVLRLQEECNESEPTKALMLQEDLKHRGCKRNAMKVNRCNLLQLFMPCGWQV